jgi:hypothetical protein
VLAKIVSGHLVRYALEVEGHDQPVKNPSGVVFFDRLRNTGSSRCSTDIIQKSERAGIAADAFNQSYCSI